MSNCSGTFFCLCLLSFDQLHTWYIIYLFCQYALINSLNYGKQHIILCDDGLVIKRYLTRADRDQFLIRYYRRMRNGIFLAMDAKKVLSALINGKYKNWFLDPYFLLFLLDLLTISTHYYHIKID